MDGNSVAVLGGGSMALAISSELSSSGFKVNMFELPRFKENIQPIIDKGGVELSGVSGSGFVKLNVVTTNAEEALRDVNLIILAVPAFGYEAFVQASLPYLRDGQIFLIATGYFGCLRLARTIHNTGKNVTLAEMCHPPYTCMKTGPASLIISLRRDELYIAAFPGKDTPEVADSLKSVFPKIMAASNVLHTSLDNCNWIIHPPVTLLHRGFIDRTRKFAMPQRDSFPLSVSRLVERMEKEKMELGKALGLSIPSIKAEWQPGVKSWQEELGELKKISTYQYEYENSSNQYLVEDLYYALPAISSLAKLAKVPIPTINAMIHFFSIIDGVDYMQEGLNLEKMGFANFSIEEILRFVEGGS
jgi:opine dehydrogenase